MEIGKIILEIAAYPRWSSLTSTVMDLFTIYDCNVYFDILSQLFTNIDMWETSYIHIMNSHDHILEMIRSSGLKPNLEKLERPEDKQIFTEEVRHQLARAYPIMVNGNVLFPFK